jgi:phospholipid transport system transporter-binding protein
MMNLSFQSEGNRTTIRFNGPLIINHAAKIRAELLDNLDPQKEIELDFSGITACDTAGMQILIALQRQFRRDKTTIFSRLGELPESIVQSARELGLDHRQLFNVE